MNLNELKPLVNDTRDWPIFKEYLETLLAVSYQNIAGATDLLTIGREQGKIAIIKQLIRLRENVNGK